MKDLSEKIKNRVEQEAIYMVKNKATVRQVSKVQNISKSTVYIDIVERLPKYNKKLYLKAKQILCENKQERHLRGGMATKAKYTVRLMGKEQKGAS